MPRGIVRRLDRLGRATLPKEYRKTMGLEDRAEVDIKLIGQVVVVRPSKYGYMGIKRSLDELGRITLPMEFRKSLEFDDCELVDMYIEDGEIYIVKEKLQCVCCGSTNERELRVHQGVHLCNKCLAEFNNK